MRSRQHGLLRLVTSVVLLSAAVSCTGEDSPEPEPSPTPQPTPTVYAGEAPPGLAAQPLRYLHDPAQPGQDILSDPLGVRIHSVGDAFLISSNSEERHLLQHAADGTVLWQGESHIERFTQDRDGADVFEVSTRTGDRVTRTVVNEAGETVWTGSDPRESYLNGLVVRAPAEWSASDPYGTVTLRDPAAEGGSQQRRGPRHGRRRRRRSRAGRPPGSPGRGARRSRAARRRRGPAPSPRPD